MDDLQHTEDAAGWLIRLEHDATAQCRAEFNAWLKRSPLNMQEFLLVTAAYKELNGLDPSRCIDVDEYIGQLSAGRSPNIVALRNAAQRAGVRAISWAREPVGPPAADSRADIGRDVDAAHVVPRHRWRTVGLAAALACTAVLLSRWLGVADSQNYATALGEQRAVKLADGSVIQMNTHSRLQVHYSGKAREVQLLEGEALFVVEHDPARPFRVMTDDVTIQALGTQFNVYRHESSTTISVVEGAVTVFGGKDIGQPETATPPLTAGEEIQVSHDGRIVKQAPAEVARTIAWRQRKLDFRGAALAEVAEQFNRYNHLQIRIEASPIAARELNGVFNADEPQALLDFLARDPDLQFEKHDNEIVIRSRP